jgi:primosomal protein N' (replication factor Y) (superfamily II helicase)
MMNPPEVKCAGMDAAEYQTSYWQLALNIPHQDTWMYQFHPDFLETTQDQNIPYLKAGQLVWVEFKNKKEAAVIIEECIDLDLIQSMQKKTTIKPILQLSDYYLSAADLAYAKFIAQYYHEGLGEALFLGFPKGLKKNELWLLPEKIKKYRSSPVQAFAESTQSSTADSNFKNSFAFSAHNTLQPLNIEQSDILKKILESSPHSKFMAHLIHGVTGSGKTRLYMELVRQFLIHAAQINRPIQILILVPEINLTPALIQQFIDYFCQENWVAPHEITALHSQLTEVQRLKNYLAAQQGAVKIIIGTRSAVHVPLPFLSLIVVDEEHDASYKQQDSIRYHARDLAIWRAAFHKIPILLVSATPSLETYHKAKSDSQNSYQYHQLLRKASNSQLSRFELIDLKYFPANSYGLSQPLLTGIHKALEKNQQALLFVNQRGYAPAIFCKDCSHTSQCPACSVNLVWHARLNSMQCHHCGYKKPYIKKCSACCGENLKDLGCGTQKVADFFAENFSNYRVCRIDADEIKNANQLSKLFEQIQNKDFDIIIGTQMLAKGHDFKHITLLGLIQPDASLFAPHPRAQEKLFQQLLQVMGRAGRFLPATIMLQTRFPQLAFYQQLKAQDYSQYANLALQDREIMGIYPYAFSAELHVGDPKFDKIQQNLSFFITQTEPLLQKYGIQSSGILENPMLKRQNLFQCYIYYEHTHRSVLQRFLNELQSCFCLLKTQRWHLDLDSISF